MKTFRIVALGLAVALLAFAGTAFADTVKSGPQVGEELTTPFHPLNVNGKAAGKKHCLYCENGNAPVAMVFAREVSPGLTDLIKQLDQACERNRSSKMGSFVVFLNDDEGLNARLKKLATDNDLKRVVLSIDNPAGPKEYKVARDADVTVVLYTDRNVKANHSFKRGELTPARVAPVIADLKKTVLSIDNPAGPKGYNVSKDAGVTVVLYKNRNVKANMAYKPGSFTEKDVQSVVSALPTITKE